MTRLTLPRAVSCMVFAAVLAGAAPALAVEGGSNISANSVRDAVIAMTVADAALPAAIAGRADAASVEAAASEAAGAMASMRQAPMRRARVAAYERRIRLARNDLDCSSLWCGRRAVLMLGVGF